MIITLNSLPGSGVEKISKLLALQLGMKYLTKEKLVDRTIKKCEEKCYSKGMFLEEKFAEKLKEVIEEESKNAHVIIDWPIACWVMDNAVRIFLYSSQKARAEKITVRDKIPIGAAREMLNEEENELKTNMLSLLGINIYDAKNFDLAINIDKISQEDCAAVIIKYLKGLKAVR
ncbi:MAG: cytidylate kinase family protein [Candidatus Diapherotrites archaeon]|nr:cytidylate kinase family protein [Candidatus Diapherotrites archaeon]